jgi:hypothetical protein
MASPGIKNYDFTEKKKWRKLVWKDIARRVNNKRKARVIYLAGEQDLDRDMALNHGFKGQNMIAVEIDKPRVKALRKKGVNTIHGNLMDVLHSWPNNHKVDVVVADFCFGFEQTSVDLYDSLATDALKDACVLINFMRGRDASSNVVRKYMPCKNVLDGVIDGACPNRAIPVSEKHRALQYLYFHAWEHTAVEQGIKNPGVREVPISLLPHEKYQAMTRWFFRAMNPTLRTYKSVSGIRMDSAVFNHVLKAAKKKIGDGSSAGDFRVLYNPPCAATKRKIIAAIAVQHRYRCTSSN